MKNIFLLFTMLISLSSVAEDSKPATESKPQREPTQSMFKSGSIELGGGGGPVVRVMQLGNGVATFMGGRGMMIVNHMLTFGGGGYGLIATSDLKIGDKKEKKISFGYGGPSLGLKLFSNHLFHVDTSTLFGFGSIKLKENQKKGTLFIIEPEVNLELNVLPFMQVGLGGAYRFAFAGKELDIKSTDLFGFGGQVYVNFGDF
jgi:hypothetical protein